MDTRGLLIEIETLRKDRDAAREAYDRMTKTAGDAQTELGEIASENADLRDACDLFTQAAHDARDRSPQQARQEERTTRAIASIERTSRALHRLPSPLSAHATRCRTSREHLRSRSCAPRSRRFAICGCDATSSTPRQIASCST